MCSLLVPIPARILSPCAFDRNEIAWIRKSMQCCILQDFFFGASVRSQLRTVKVCVQGYTPTSRTCKPWDRSFWKKYRVILALKQAFSTSSSRTTQRRKTCDVPCDAGRRALSDKLLGGCETFLARWCHFWHDGDSQNGSYVNHLSIVTTKSPIGNDLFLGSFTSQ